MVLASALRAKTQLTLLDVSGMHHRLHSRATPNSLKVAAVGDISVILNHTSSSLEGGDELDNSIEDEGIFALAETVRHLPHLRTLLVHRTPPTRHNGKC